MKLFITLDMDSNDKRGAMALQSFEGPQAALAGELGSLLSGQSLPEIQIIRTLIIGREVRVH